MVAARDSGRSQPRAATDYEELAFFALSQVTVPKTASPVARAAAIRRVLDPMPSKASTPFVEDRAALSALAPNGIVAAQVLPRLHHDIASFIEVAARPLSALTPADVADVAALSALRAADGRLAELLVCDMALAAGAFSQDEGIRATERASAALPFVAGALERLATFAPALALVEVVVAAALGRSGRVYSERNQGLRTVVYVGAGFGAPNDGADHAALLALHELAVSFSAADYAFAERAAIEAVATVVHETPFAEAFELRIASLDLSNVARPSEVARISEDVLRRLKKRS